MSAYTVFKNRKYFADHEKLKQLFRDKSVAIVGPADTALRFQNGSLIDSCDIVIRFNNSYLLVDPEDPEKTAKTGSKTDILFHSFKYNKDNPAVLDTEKLQQQGVKQVFTHLRDKRSRQKGQRGHRGFRVFMKNNYEFLKDKLYLLPENVYEEMYNDLGSKPTVGHIAITLVLECQPAGLFVTGFSFFTTAYTEGYRDYTTREDQLERFKRSSTGHDPANELRFFSDLLKKTDVKVELDPYLEDLVKRG